MKVLYFLTEFPVGSETFVIDQIAGLVERGMDVSILSLTQGDLTLTNPNLTKHNLLSKTHFFDTSPTKHQNKLFKRIKLVLSRLFDVRVIKALNLAKFGRHSYSLLLPSLCAQAKNQQFGCSNTVVIAHFGTAGVIANKLAQLGIIKGKLLTVFHGAEISRHDLLAQFKEDYKQMFQTASMMLPISDKWKNRLIDLGCPSDKITVNRMGIDLKKFCYHSHPLAEGACFQITSVARLTEKKGIEYSIKAMLGLKQANINFHYDIYGDGPLLKELNSLIDELALKKHITLHGSVNINVVKERLEHTHVFLLPSITAQSGDMEGIPVALMEAMASGTLVISTEHSGIPELIENGINGFLAQEKSVSDIEAFLINIAQNYDEYEELRLNARAKVEQSFNQSILYDELKSIILSTKYIK